MPRSTPHQPRPVEERDRDHGTLLRTAGLRVTPVRLGVLRTLCQMHEALTADQIAEHIAHERGPKSRTKPDRVTVYRTLNSLVEAGIAHRVDPGDRVFRFGLTGDHAAHVPAHTCGCAEAEECTHPPVAPVATDAAEQAHGHPHFVCDECGKVECLEDTEIVLKPRRAGGTRGAPPKAMTIRQQQVLLRGTCEGCGPGVERGPGPAAGSV